MLVITEGMNLGDLLKYEAPNLYSRDQVTVASGQNLALGAVVGIVAATGKVKALDPAATDGSQTAAGVLLEPVDATAGDRDDGILLTRHAIVADHALVWPAGITNAEKAAAINLLPNNYGRLEQMGLMPEKPVRFRSIAVEEKNGVLTLLPTLPVGAPGTVGKRGKRALRTFTIPHIPHDDVVLPEEVQGVRAFGSESEVQTIAQVMAEHLQTMRNKHAITLEHLRMGALKGVILDADGSTLYDLYQEFGITPKVVNFNLGNANTDVKKKCLDIKRHLEDNLKGERMTGIHCLVSEEFFDALTSHPKVEKAYERWQDGAALRSDMRAGFTFAGITFEEYRGQAVDADGNTRRFIAAGEGHCFPLGTVDTFATYFAPADFNETANTLGRPLYAKQEPRKFDRGTDLHTQSNPLPMCHRPGVLVKVTAA